MGAWEDEVAAAQAKQAKIDAAAAARKGSGENPRILKGGGGGGGGAGGAGQAGGPGSLAGLGMLGAMLMQGMHYGQGANSAASAFGRNASDSVATASDASVYDAQKAAMMKQLADALKSHVPAGPSRGAGYGMGAPSGPSEQFQLNKAHKEQMYQQDQAYNQKARGAALDFNYQQRGANMKSKLALQLLHGILGGRGGLNGPRVTTEDSQGIGERGGVSVPVSLHSTQSVKPGGSDRAQMMAQLLQAITGMI